VTRPKTIGGRLAAILASKSFAVTGEIVPPRSADGGDVSHHARGHVGYVDAVNVTDNPTATAHMSAVAGAAFVARAGLEPTLQVTVRDRNRLAITSDLLGGWAVGARNVLCLSGDPLHLGDHPDASRVDDIDLLELIGLVRGLRDAGRTLGGSEIADPPRYLIGVADMPLADPYEPERLERKLEAGADVVWTQITYDVEALAAWADVIRAHGVHERAKVVVGVVPLRTAKGARFMDERLPGVRVPPRMIADLDAAGDDAEGVGLELTVGVVKAIKEIEGVSGVHIMGMGRDDLVRGVVEGAGLFPRPTGIR
jgi:methylenetetrahydrofolate reductase (NADPH)